jgi:light-regulated signal transduction histidine kinase (bacteriophytochrome)
MRAGKRVAFSMNLIPLFSRDGKLEFVAMTYKDETEVSLARLNLEAKVAERTRDMETFIGSVSHDLRAPMRSIGGFAQVLLQDHAASLDPEGRGHLQRIADAARRMEVLVDGLLSFFRLGQKAVDVSDVSTEQLVRQALEDLSAERVPHTMELVMGELPSCRADPVLLRQVFVNLINNALKFSGRRPVPRVEVGSRLEGDERVWFVRDNGAGFDMGLKDRLFGMFQRLHPMSDFEGNGIGLALVRRIVEKHGGRVWAQSAPGEGATFYFTLKT